MRHHVDPPAEVPPIPVGQQSPVGGGRAGRAVTESDPGVGDEQVDRAVVPFDRRHHLQDLVLDADIGAERNPLHFGCHGRGRRPIDIGDDKPPAVALQPPANGTADAVSAAGHDRQPVLDNHLQ